MCSFMHLPFLLFFGQGLPAKAGRRVRYVAKQSLELVILPLTRVLGSQACTGDGTQTRQACGSNPSLLQLNMVSDREGSILYKDLGHR